MLELPWYAWLNLAGLLALWAFYWLSHDFEGSPAWLRFAHYLAVLVAAGFVTAHGSGRLDAEAGAGIKLLAVFLLAVLAWEVLFTLGTLALWRRTHGAGSRSGLAAQHDDGPHRDLIVPTLAGLLFVVLVLGPPGYLALGSL